MVELSNFFGFQTEQISKCWKLSGFNVETLSKQVCFFCVYTILSIVFEPPTSRGRKEVGS